MLLSTEPFSRDEIIKIKSRWGNYVKVTADIVAKVVVAGPQLHIDAVPLLKEGGSIEENIWGGWVNFELGEVETLAVWNIRPQLNNPGMEIMNQNIRDRFIELVKSYFRL